MDGSEQTSPLKQNTLLHLATGGVKGIFLGLVSIVILFLILNYFNIIPPSSRLYPQWFGSLPHKPYTIQVPKTSQQTNATPPSSGGTGGDLTLRCPTVKDFCETGRDIFANGTYAGFGTTLPSGSTLTAVFSGVLTIETTPSPVEEKENITAVYIDNAELDLRATYYFKGSVQKETGEVKTGEIIGTVDQPMTTTSLLFLLTQGDPENEEYIPLSKENFE